MTQMQRRDFIKTGALWTLAAAVLPYKRRFWPVGIDLRKPGHPDELFLYGTHGELLSTLSLGEGFDLMVSPYELKYSGVVDVTGVVSHFMWNEHGGSVSLPYGNAAVMAGQPIKVVSFA